MYREITTDEYKKYLMDYTLDEIAKLQTNSLAIQLLAKQEKLKNEILAYVAPFFNIADLNTDPQVKIKVKPAKK